MKIDFNINKKSYIYLKKESFKYIITKFFTNKMKVRDLKDAIKNRQVVTGIKQFIHDPTLTQIYGKAGFDFVFLDTEHGGAGWGGSELYSLVNAAWSVDLCPLVRCYNDPQIIQKVMETGARGLWVPDVDTKEAVIQAVDYTRFKPWGKRGVCPSSKSMWYGSGKEYYVNVAEETVFILILESLEAFDNLEEILKTCAELGVDATMFGGGDLSAHLGVWHKPQAEKEKALEPYRLRWLDASRKYGVAMTGSGSGDIEKQVKEGITIFTTAPDTGAYFNHWRDYVNRIKTNAAIA